MNPFLVCLRYHFKDAVDNLFEQRVFFLENRSFMQKTYKTTENPNKVINQLP